MFTSSQMAKTIPSTFEQVRATAMLVGFVSNVTADAVYVRFLGGLTGQSQTAALLHQSLPLPWGWFVISPGVCRTGIGSLCKQGWHQLVSSW